MISSDTRSHVLCISMAVLLAPALAPSLIEAQTSQIPLTIVRAQEVPRNSQTGEPGHIAVTIRNTGTKTIVSWGVASETRLTDGSVKRGFVTADAILQLDKLPRDPTLLPPQTEYVVTMNSLADDAKSLDIAATCAFVIFDDDTALGNVAEIEKTFSNRVTSVAMYRLMEQTFAASGRGITDPSLAARANRAALEAMTDITITRHWVYQYYLRRLSSIIEDPRHIDMSQALSQIVAHASSMRVVAEAHQRRR